MTDADLDRFHRADDLARFYCAAADKIPDGVFASSLTFRPGDPWPGYPAHITTSLELGFTPGDATLYRILLTRVGVAELAVALLNVDHGAGIVPWRPWDVHHGYVRQACWPTGTPGDCTVHALTSVINRASAVCLGRGPRG